MTVFLAAALSLDLFSVLSRYYSAYQILFLITTPATIRHPAPAVPPQDYGFNLEALQSISFPKHGVSHRTDALYSIGCATVRTQFGRSFGLVPVLAQLFWRDERLTVLLRLSWKLCFSVLERIFDDITKHRHDLIFDL